MLTITPQVSPRVQSRAVVSHRTCGFALCVAHWVAEGSSSVAAAAMATDWRILPRQVTQSPSNWELSSQTGQRVSCTFAAPTDLSADQLSTDVYCYACDDSRLDPLLAQHLSTFGIEVAGQKKTEKSMTELVSQPPVPCGT